MSYYDEALLSVTWWYHARVSVVQWFSDFSPHQNYLEAFGDIQPSVTVHILLLPSRVELS